MTNYITPEQCDKLSQTLCEILEGDLGSGEQDVKTVVYAVCPGGLMPALHISNHFKIPLEFIEIATYPWVSPHKPQQINTLPSVADLNSVERVIIADGYVDTGKTMKSIVDYLNAIKESCDLDFEIITVAMLVSNKEQLVTIDHWAGNNSSGLVVFPYEKRSGN